MPVINPTKHTFDLSVVQKSQEGPIVVLVSAPWCGPCKRLKPKVLQIVEEWDLTLATISADDEPELMRRLSIRSVPTLLIISKGLEVQRLLGDATEVELRRFLLVAGVSYAA